VSGPTVDIGPYVVGEIPPPLEYVFLDSSGVPINLTGYTARFQRAEIQGGFVDPITVNATVTDAVNGQVTYTWIAADFPHAGRFGGMFFVGNGVNRYASWLITWTTCASVDTPPNI
jgi:hypothetical protein